MSLQRADEMSFSPESWEDASLMEDEYKESNGASVAVSV